MEGKILLHGLDRNEKRQENSEHGERGLGAASTCYLRRQCSTEITFSDDLAFRLHWGGEHDIFFA